MAANRRVGDLHEAVERNTVDESQSKAAVTVNVILANWNRGANSFNSGNLFSA